MLAKPAAVVAPRSAATMPGGRWICNVSQRTFDLNAGVASGSDVRLANFVQGVDRLSHFFNTGVQPERKSD